MARRRRHGSLGTTSLPPGSTSLPTMLPRPTNLPAGPAPMPAHAVPMQPMPMPASSQPVSPASPVSPPPPPAGERWWKKRKFGAPVWLWGALGVAVVVAIWRRKDIGQGLTMLKNLIVKPAFPSNFGIGRGNPPTKIDTIVIHTTAGGFQSAVNWFAMDHKDPALKGGPYGASSAHYTIGKDGRIAQSVSVDDTAYHANDFAVNRRSVGIELEGMPDDPANFTPAMMDTLVALTQELLTKFPGIQRVRGIPGFVGHQEIPGGKKVGKVDPGPYFPWASYMARIGGSNTPTNIA